MSFHSDVAAVWPADLVTAGVVTAAGQVTFGRTGADKVDARGAIWIERLPETRGGAGGQHVIRYPYLLHLRATPRNLGSDKTGAAQLTAVEARAQTIVSRYNAAVPFLATRTKMLPAAAAEESLDTDPGEGSYVEATVRVTLSEWE